MTDMCTDIPGTRGKPMKGHFWNMTHPQGQDPEIPILGIKPREAEQAKFQAPAEPTSENLRWARESVPTPAPQAAGVIFYKQFIFI